MLSQRPSLTWHSSRQWRKKKKIEVEETRSAVQHASLCLLFLLESSHQKIPFQPLFVRMHKLFFSPGFPLQLREKSVAFGSSRDSTTSAIFFTHIESTSFERCIFRLDTLFYATHTGINFIDLDDIRWFSNTKFAKCQRDTSNERKIWYLLTYIGYFWYNFQLICETSILKIIYARG